MEVSSILPASGYVGVDLSAVAIERNRELYPDRSFYCGDFLELDLSPTDMVVCMDVLIHINDDESYNRFVAKLVEKNDTGGCCGRI